MKKSIAVLSLSLASLLGLAACAPAVKAPVASRDSASASASVSPSASPSAEDSQSASESPSASSENSSKPSSSASARETASGGSTDEGGAAESRKLAMDLYKTYANSVSIAEGTRSVVKGENADGKTYTSERNKVTLVAGKDNEYIIRIKHDGSWSRARANGEAELVDTDGSWIRIKPDGERIAVKGSGAVYISYHQGDVPKDLINTLETPKLPAPVEGGVGVPKEPVKPTKISSVTN